MTPDQRLLANVAGFLAGVVLLIAGGAWAGYAWRDRGARADLAECQRTHAEALAVTLRAAQQAEAEFRTQDAKTRKQQQEAIDAAHRETQAAQADAGAVRAALDRLRQRAAAAARGGQAPADPAPAASSPPARGADDLQADLLGRLGEAAGQLAEYADAAATAGRACERGYPVTP